MAATAIATQVQAARVSSVNGRLGRGEPEQAQVDDRDCADDRRDRGHVDHLDCREGQLIFVNGRRQRGRGPELAACY